MTPADRILIVLTLLCLPLIYTYYWQSPSYNGEYVDVYDINGHQQRVSLEQDQHFSVTGKYGQSEFEIKQQAVRFIRSPCTQKYCVHKNWLSQSGELMACLPNAVYIKVGGGQAKYDAINY